MSVPFRTAPFKTAGGTTARMLSAWFGDVINVKEMGAVGNGIADDTAAIQATFDLAFGNPPNGWANRHLNRPVFFPAGKYNVASTLTLTKVVGGHIYGAGKHATQIILPANGPGTLMSLLHMNGCADLCIEKLTLEFINFHLGGDNTCVLRVDWDGDNSGNGCNGNHDNLFQEIAFGTGQYTVIIGSNAASQGHSNLLLNCTLTGSAGRSQVAIDVRGPNAINNKMIGGGGISYPVAFIRCPSGGGSIHAQGLSIAGSALEYVMDSDKVMHISQCRTESTNMLKMSNGVVTLHGLMGATGTINVAEITGGKCIIEGCYLHPAGQIIGTGGQLYLAGNFFGSSVTPLSGYSGTKVWNPDGIT